ncbi:ParB/RepB/Spo0J family partition protein [Shewanella aestuarii]|uniref:ParB/Spo0J HTH domain-containing protein n=1 Tax=Shewanella aestuarii TaxID=1028752 RepID=A0A6G9QRE5_9GAMM|nr:ParB/RepB/Spo0J family partition protein [Shewanella aestuarii]QIR16673.1 hypothetical protein HBH39_19565 [Shewanella aestuarii]
MFNTIDTKYEELQSARLRDMYRHEKEHSAPEDMKVGTLNSYVVTTDRIFVEEGFNIRDLNENHVTNFANAYRENKTVPQIIVKVVKNAEGEYICIVRDGHHRFAGGIQAGKTEFEVNEFQGDKIDEVLLMIDTANGLPLNQLDLAAAVSRLKNEGLNNSEIGRRINKSSAHVGHLLDLLNMPQRLKDMVRNDMISATYARELFKEHGDKVMSVIASSSNNSNQPQTLMDFVPTEDESDDKKVEEIHSFVEQIKKDSKPDKQMTEDNKEKQIDIEDVIAADDLAYLNEIGQKFEEVDNSDDSTESDSIEPTVRVTKKSVKGKSIPKSISTDVRTFILKLASQVNQDEDQVIKLTDDEYYELKRFEEALIK